jgi:hypothetical protein
MVKIMIPPAASVSRVNSDDHASKAFFTGVLVGIFAGVAMGYKCCSAHWCDQVVKHGAAEWTTNKGLKWKGE